MYVATTVKPSRTIFLWYRDTADALLRHEGVDWRSFVDYSVRARVGKNDVYPLMMLIKEMPGIIYIYICGCTVLIL